VKSCNGGVLKKSADLCKGVGVFVLFVKFSTLLAKICTRMCGKSSNFAGGIKNASKKTINPQE
jgi:hypothetical protein